MKTFFVTVAEPKKRSVHLTKGIVIAESEGEALQVVRNHYPPTAKGWHPEATFRIVEMQEKRFFPV